jgi:hypothetical protein
VGYLQPCGVNVNTVITEADLVGEGLSDEEKSVVIQRIMQRVKALLESLDLRDVHDSV